jgi:hypothetical protein
MDNVLSSTIDTNASTILMSRAYSPDSRPSSNRPPLSDKKPPLFLSKSLNNETDGPAISSERLSNKDLYKTYPNVKETNRDVDENNGNITYIYVCIYIYIYIYIHINKYVEL